MMNFEIKMAKKKSIVKDKATITPKLHYKIWNNYAYLLVITVIQLNYSNLLVMTVIFE